MIEIIVILAVTAFLVLIIGAIIWMLSKNSASVTAAGSVQVQLEALRAAQERLSQTVSRSLQSGQETVNKNLQFHAEALAKLGNQLGDLQRSGKQMTELGSDVRKLHDVLANPKHRGGFGEWSLENILKKVLPLESFVLQYHFRDGKTVDALVKMPDYSVPVDAKFPLENFKKIQMAQNDEQAAKAGREFFRDVKKHIDKIAESYIRPEEGTLDFALMFVPAENVYYEMIVDFQRNGGLNISDYAQSRKVIPVSPNLLYVYLMTVVMGLHGLKIEAAAGRIRQNLKAISSSFAEFLSSWDTLGGHIRNAGTKYDESQKKLDRLVMQLEQVQNDDKDDIDY